jgi:hypothetical protein
MNLPSRRNAKLIYLRPADRRQIEELAAKLNISHSEAVRRAIALFAQKPPQKGEGRAEDRSGEIA